MRLHRFILDLDLADDRLVISDFETINQIRNVLRLEVGDRFVVCDGKGKEATVQIFTGPLGPSERDAPKGAGNILVDVLDRRDVASESSARVTLYCAVLKRENFELVVQKVTECGIAAIVPIISTRTVKLGVKLERLEKIAREASEQSGRGVIPEILGPIPLKDAIVHARDNASNVVFELGAPLFTGTLVPSRLDATKVAGKTGLFIGPEGGWDDAEVEQLRAAGYHIAGLGPRVLRAETAAIVAVYLSTGNRN